MALTITLLFPNVPDAFSISISFVSLSGISCTSYDGFLPFSNL